MYFVNSIKFDGILLSGFKIRSKTLKKFDIIFLKWSFCMLSWFL